MRCKVLALAAVALACMVSPAQAQTITYEYTSDALSYSGAVGSTVVVNLYLTETLTGGAKSIIGPSGTEFGLTSAALSVSQSSATVGLGSTITGGAINSNAYNAATPGFNATNTGSTIIAQYNGNTGGAFGLNDAVVTGSGTNVPPGTHVSTVGGTVTNAVFLGSMTVTIAAGTTTYLIDSPDQSPAGAVDVTGDETNTTQNGLLLDQNGTFTYNSGPNNGTTVNWIGTEDPQETFTVIATAVVPEPSSMLLCGLAISGAGFRAWRRRRNQTTETEPTPAV